MIDPVKYNQAVEIINSLPDRDGLVVYNVEQSERGETTSTWAVEFHNQTIMLHFIFDDTEQRERVFADLLARGASVIQYFMQEALECDQDKNNLMVAFNLTFNAVMQENQKLKTRIEDLEKQLYSKDENIGTVGES